ncbi:MAG TPA: hypothetical protein VG817_10645, partial [Gemmatimonadales bacterium]|nr:hypothetical protein [Gemmatimonadales bacterium]
GLMRSTFRRNRNLVGMAECSAGSDAACAELLRSLDPGQLPQPLLAESRQVLVRQALRVGGRDAYHRLMADTTASLAARFERAAGIPIDSLVVLWRNAVLAARPEPVSLPVTGALAGIGWVLLLGYFGLRSSRWRRG